MDDIELIDGRVYWVRPTTRTDGIADEPVLAQYRDYRDDDDEDDEDQTRQYIYYFGTDWFDHPKDVIIVAGPLKTPPPPGSEVQP